MSAQHKCPRCGARLNIIKIKIAGMLTTRQRNIRDCIDTVKRNTQRDAARIEDIATETGWSVRTIQREVQVLVQFEVIYHPNGPKGGVDLRPDDEIAIVLDQAA